MEEIAKIQKRFGDEQSTLLDQFERLSFEAHLNKAMLHRSISETGFPRSLSLSLSSSRLFNAAPTTMTPLVNQVNHQGRRHHCRGGGDLAFHKVFKKLLKPFLGRKNNKQNAPDPKNPLSWKAFSRSLRF